MGRFDGRRVSLTRLTVLVAVVAGLTFAGTSHWRQVQDAQAAGSNEAAWFAPYVDATLTPTSSSRTRSQPGHRRRPRLHRRRSEVGPCAPTWGGAYTPRPGPPPRSTSTAASPGCSSSGGTSIVRSAGWPTTSSPSPAPTRPSSRRRTRRGRRATTLATIDLDIEGAALPTRPRSSAGPRRSRPCRRSAGRRQAPLAVWLTLPVARTVCRPPARTRSDGHARRRRDARRRQRDDDGLRHRRRRSQTMLDATEERWRRPTGSWAAVRRDRRAPQDPSLWVRSARRR